MAGRCVLGGVTSGVRLLGQIFKIEREGESQRYKPFKQLRNRRLLWHGSRTTNFAGILSQGLRIAPPEAPVVRAWRGARGRGLV